MNVSFTGYIAEVKDGITLISEELGFKPDVDGLEINIEKSDGRWLEVSKRENRAVVRYAEKVHFFRGLGLLFEAMGKEAEFEIVEEPVFLSNGVMFDVSQGNAVIRVENIKKLLVKMALMGLNIFMLYTEDSYVINDEPYFGYLRSKYSYEELKELDDFAFSLGIEMIPCIQTLAHLIDVLKWKCYSDLREDDGTLLVGYQRTYEFIEKMIRAASFPFRSKRIHIGMDEAWKLGLGRYLEINGYRCKIDIMLEHLERVCDIARKYGLRPMIWSDMLFMDNHSKNDNSGTEYNSQSVNERVPKDLDLVFWNYEEDNEEFYIRWIKKHKELGKAPMFAGAVWSWLGFGVNYGKTFSTANKALTACKKEGVSEVFTTIWGDDCTESSIYSTLLGLQLYAEHGYSREVDLKKVKDRFKYCTDANFDDFMDIKYIDEIPGTASGNPEGANPSKYLMWQDILLGQFDRNIRGLDIAGHYKNTALLMKESSVRNSKWSFLFDFLEKVCNVLSIKSDIGNRIIDAYKSGNREFLWLLSDVELPELAVRVADLRRLHRRLWMETNKPAGWEVLDLRYGAVLMRIDTAAARIAEYLDGRIKIIEELEEDKLYFTGKPGLEMCYIYSRVATASRISATTCYFGSIL